MPLPAQQDAHVDALLTNMSIMYAQGATTGPKGFVADRALPPLDVKRQSDKIAIWSKADFMRIEIDRGRANGDEAVEGGYRVTTTTTYFCEAYAIKKLLTARDIANHSSPLMAEEAAVKYVTSQLLLKREAVFAATCFGGSIWGQDLTGVSSNPSTNQFLQWDDGDSNPIDDIRTAHGVIEDKIGTLAATLRKVLVVGSKVHRTLVDHSDVLDRIKYTQKGVVTEDLLASLLGVDEYLVAWGVKNTAAEGASGSYSQIVTNTSALLLYTTRAPALDQPSAGYTMRWDEFDAMGNDGAAIKSYDDPKRDFKNATWYEGQIAFVPKITATDLGVEFVSAVA